MRSLFSFLLVFMFAASTLAQTYSAELENKALSGDVDAQIRIANCYYNGNGVSKDYNKAVLYYQMAANQNSPHGQAALADCYLKGTGVAQDVQTGLKWMQKAADNNYAPAQYSIGYYYMSGTYWNYISKNYSLAKKWYEKAAEQNHALAEHNLGVMYDKWLIGGDVLNPFDHKPQKELATKYFLRAAQHGCAITIEKVIPLLVEQGNAEATRILGRCYEYGTGFTKDETKAIDLYKKAINRGDDIAIVYLAAFLNNKENYDEAYPYWEMYVEKHKDDTLKTNIYSLSVFKVGHYLLNGWGVAKNAQKSIPYLEKASQMNYGMASLDLGQCYANGMGVIKNADKAIEYFTLAIKQGDGNKVSDIARRQLASMYGFGEGVDKDAEKAYLYLKGISDKDDYTHLLLGQILYADTKTISHYEKAITNLRIAKESNDKDISGIACFYLSKCYRMGYGCVQDLDKAESLWQEAISKGCKDASDVDKLNKERLKMIF